MDLEQIRLFRGDREAKFHGSWYRGEHTNFIPAKADLRQAQALEEYVLYGWAPSAPFITKHTPVTAIGSCFATHLTRFLVDRGYAVFGNDLGVRAHIVRFGAGMVNTFAIRQQLEWALANRDLPSDLWFGADKEVALPTEAIRQETREIIKRTEVFIFTLGLSEIWYDKISGEAFWRAIPASHFDPDRHGFRLSSVEENYDNIVASIDLVMSARPDASVVLSLSPVPLMATFRPISCLTASSVSKAILRIALDQIMAQNRPRVYYYPAYEMVTSFPDPFKADNRHPRDEIVASVLRVFEKAYCRA